VRSSLFAKFFFRFFFLKSFACTFCALFSFCDYPISSSLSRRAALPSQTAYVSSLRKRQICPPHYRWLCWRAADVEKSSKTVRSPSIFVQLLRKQSPSMLSVGESSVVFENYLVSFFLPGPGPNLVAPLLFFQRYGKSNWLSDFFSQNLL